MSKSEQGVRLVEQLEELYALEGELIAREDWDRFNCEELLRVARGETTLRAIAWGYDHAGKSDEERLAAWNRAVGMSNGD